MASILFNNDNDPLKGKKTETGSSQSATPVDKTEVSPAIKSEEDFAIFPQWDVAPPNAIINPRIKKNI